MNKKFTFAVLGFLALLVSISFVTLATADSSVKGSEANNEMLDVSSPDSVLYTTFVNYDFNNAIANTTPCNQGRFTTFGGITSKFSTSTGTCMTQAGTATSAAAFTQNPDAGSAVGIAGFANNATQYFQFQLSGSFPATVVYISLDKVYFQARRSETGPTSLTLQTSSDGTVFYNVQTVSLPTDGTNAFADFVFDLSRSSVSFDQPEDFSLNVYFRIVGSGGSDESGTLTIDNFQVFGGIFTQPPPITPTPTPTVSPTPRRAELDFDGDNKSDYANFRPANSTWFVRRSSDGGTTSVQFGLPDDRLTPGDYDGDKRTDISVWRPSNGYFYVLKSSDNTFLSVQFGLFGDEPVARDYSGDNRTDFAVVRRTGGQMIWYILTSNNFTFSATQFGLDTDVAAPGDYDGDGRYDLAVYRGSGADRTGQATFFVQLSNAPFIPLFRAVQFGLGSDLVVPGDYDGDGRYDFAVVREGSPYNWYILTSKLFEFNFRAVQFGTKPFIPTQADYDGDGKTDISVWSPQNATFYTLTSSNGAVSTTQFGQNGDLPVADFDTF